MNRAWPNRRLIQSIPRTTGYLRSFQAEASAPSTFRELAVNLMGAGIKEEVMTIEQQIRQEGWKQGQQEGWKQGLHEGQQQGTLIGQIQNCQELLELPVMDIESLARKSQTELESLLQQLKSSLRSRVGH